jgi:hypothetical protein
VLTAGDDEEAPVRVQRRWRNEMGMGIDDQADVLLSS